MCANSFLEKLLAYTPVYLSRMHSGMMDVMRGLLKEEEKRITSLRRIRSFTDAHFICLKSICVTVWEIGGHTQS